MSRNILVILAEAAEAEAVRRSLSNSPDGPFNVEWVSQCAAAIERLGDPRKGEVTAIVVGLFLADSEGIETFDALFRAQPEIPILILSRLRDEAVARLAVTRGAQDYLLEERRDDHSMPRALASMLARSAHAEALSLERGRAQVTLASIGDAVISTDVAGNITYLNPVAESMTGWSAQEASGRQLQEVLRLIDGGSREPALNPLAMAILHDKTVGLSENCVLIRRDGYETAIEDTAAPIRDRRGQVTGAVIVFHDVSAARAMSLRMSYLAQHDFLTELPNRMLLNDRLVQAMALAHRHHTALAVLFVDVDRFKQINDSVGHTGGDQLLKSIARRLVGCVRNSDTVSRYGGDEFVVLLSEVAHSQDAALSARKILVSVRAAHRIEHQELSVTVSTGIAVFPDDGTDAAMLLKNADTALLNAKALGRGNHQFFQPGMNSRGG
jgi:diguanylate cyclase (GGDEF)-like protein/PAS domain S-box-containing protein